MQQLIDPTRQPIVTAKDGAVFANSRDIAAYFEKRHDHVLDAIDELSSQLTGDGVPEFRETPYTHPQNGQTYRSYDMDRDGFTLLAMGFTGAKALQWKLKYIEAFNSMEAKLRADRPDAMLALNDPATLRNLLSNYSERVLTLESRVEEMQPDVEALDRIAKSDGSLCITDAAKTLQVQPKALFSFLRSHRWIYTRAGSNQEIAFQDKLASGLLEHKTTTITKSDGSEKTVTQVRVTPKGLTRLAKEFPPVVSVAQSGMRFVG